MNNSNVRAAFWTDALAPVAPKEEPGIDPAEVSMADWAEYRQGRIKNTTDVRGVDADNPVARGREIAQMFQPRLVSESMAAHAQERQQAHVKQASDIFGAEPVRAARNPSPYSPYAADPRRRAGN